MSRLRTPRRMLAASAVAALTMSNGDKLPIYDIQTPPIVLVESPSRLETEIGVARRAVTGAGRNAHAKVQRVVDRWIAVEHAIENRVKSIFLPSEPLTPGILYVGVTTLTGTILTRTRGLPTRLFIPPVFLLASFRHFLPQTSANLGAYVFSLEKAYMPMVAERHGKLDASIRRGWTAVRNGVGKGKERVTSAAETVVNRVQDATGLKLRETFGAGRDEDTSTKKS